MPLQSLYNTPTNTIPPSPLPPKNLPAAQRNKNQETRNTRARSDNSLKLVALHLLAPREGEGHPARHWGREAQQEENAHGEFKKFFAVHRGLEGV